ncbi:hypothetical protein QR98_0046790 [Sarcoptes scabiei]|uniref:Uncharacterized protein n=1 Tax=Sarcoptes scabiei TaxID=52283 RepID=A0A132A5F7_SARSC|nr:hypothetical protein QR98_0046790 [Sarcoptes scabiei]
MIEGSATMKEKHKLSLKMTIVSMFVVVLAFFSIYWFEIDTKRINTFKNSTSEDFFDKEDLLKLKQKMLDVQLFSALVKFDSEIQKNDSRQYDIKNSGKTLVKSIPGSTKCQRESKLAKTDHDLRQT